MPKRTDKFQSLVATICEQCASIGVVAEESAFVQEKSGDETDREVDIVLATVIMGLPFRVAVECRARSRKETIEWIDSLIGKYIDVTPKIDRIVAVSKTGFPASAIAKAKKHRIETVKLEDAFLHDWPNEFQCLKVAQIDGVDFSDYRLRISPPPNSPLNDAVVVFPDSTEHALDEFFAGVLVPAAQRMILNRVQSDISKFFPNMQAVKEGRLLFEVGIPSGEASIRNPMGDESTVSVFNVLVTLKMYVTEVENSFATTSATDFDPLNRICITTASLQRDDGTPVDVSVIQRKTPEGVIVAPIIKTHGK